MVACERCGKEFEPENTEADALEEATNTFGINAAAAPKSELALLCDDCYAAFMEWFKALKN